MAARKTAANSGRQRQTAAKANPYLGIWSDLETTDPTYTKSFKGSGFKGTAINATYTAKKLTEKFGPVGIGWRLVIDDEKYIPGHLLSDGATRCVIHVLRGHIEYRYHPDVLSVCNLHYEDPDLPKWQATSPQYGQTPFVFENRNGIQTDADAPKKSCTDLLSKTAAHIGCSADVYLGLFDDNRFVSATATTRGAAKPIQDARAAAGPPQPVPLPSGPPAATENVIPWGQPSTNAGAAVTISVNLPSDCGGWDASTWIDFVNRTTDPETMLAAFGQVRETPGLQADRASYEAIITAISNRARQIVPHGSAVWNTLIVLFKDESKKREAADA